MYIAYYLVTAPILGCIKNERENESQWWWCVELFVALSLDENYEEKRERLMYSKCWQCIILSLAAARHTLLDVSRRRIFVLLIHFAGIKGEMLCYFHDIFTRQIIVLLSYRTLHHPLFDIYRERCVSSMWFVFEPIISCYYYINVIFMSWINKLINYVYV